MTPTRPVPALLLVLGGGCVLASVLWWSLTFWPPVSNSYLSIKEAGRCLVNDSSLCRLATSLCGTRHALLVASYSPLLLWSGATLAFGGLWSALGNRKGAAPRKGAASRPQARA